MARLPKNSQLIDKHGNPLNSLLAINRLDNTEKEQIYTKLLPNRLCQLVGLSSDRLHNADGQRLVTVVALTGLPILRLEVRAKPADNDTIFFLELSDTQFGQMELSFCIICDPASERYDVDIDEQGKINWFASHGRNIPEELRAMQAGLFPNQTQNGLRLFAEFFPLLERFTDSLGMEMIVAEPLTYDNAIRYEKYGFDYLRGKRLMLEIDRKFQPGGSYYSKLNGSTLFRKPGMERTVRGRSWAIHDGIMDEAWDCIEIYKMIGVDAGINTFPSRKQELCR